MNVTPAEPHPFQFEDLNRRLPREASQRDLVLYLPDRVVSVNYEQSQALLCEYDFSYKGRGTVGLDRSVAARPIRRLAATQPISDHGDGEFAHAVSVAKQAFGRGDLFEVVLGQRFSTTTALAPSEIFRHLSRANPAPYAALVNLGAGEHLVSASPEMYVRVNGDRVESCPISGTIERGKDAITDAERVRDLLNSAKDEAELTMCTDVDRNDKSRICEPGSVRVIGRRQIEMSSKVIHTVDHIEGRLRKRYDALDAFLTHMWASTVTGAPKLWAMRFIEEHEKTSRRWYGGAIGFVGFDGSLNTGLTLRTVRLQDGQAEVRAGGTLLADSVPDAEAQEVALKASAFLEAVASPTSTPPSKTDAGNAGAPDTGVRDTESSDAVRVLLLDCQDSFVHTLANYVRAAGGRVRTVRAPLPPTRYNNTSPTTRRPSSSFPPDRDSPATSRSPTPSPRRSAPSWRSSGSASASRG